MRCVLTVHTDHGLYASIETIVGTKLSDVLRENGFSVDAPCGGRGTCGKCKIRARGKASLLTNNEQSRLSDVEIHDAYRLACMVTIEGDMEVWLQEQSHSVLIEGENQTTVCIKPTVVAKALPVVQPSLENQFSDQDRIGIEDATLSVIRKLPEVLRVSGGSIWAVIDLHKACVLDVASSRPKFYGVAVDIGTTTIAAYLLDLQMGCIRQTASSVNPQRAYGADVITRIDYAREEEGLSALQSCIASEIFRLIQSMVMREGVQESSIFEVVCVGNTVMLHLLLGVSPKYIATAPFIPAFTQQQHIKATEVGIPLPNARLYVAPCVAGYVGADTTAAVLACDMQKQDELSLLVDIGTNGEIALGKGRDIVCCSAAAGPAFEGAHISCGSGAVAGAVCAVRFDDGGEVHLQCIGDRVPTSLCGSGLVDAVAEMLRVGLIDETGRIDDEEASAIWENRLFSSSGGTAFALTEDRSVYITQKDIREVQLAKGAIAAGISVLLQSTGHTVDEVKNLYLAGGFGNYMNIESACRIGLLPAPLAKQAKPIGNAAGTGAKRILLNVDERNEVVQIAQQMRYIELSSQKGFADLLTENLLFPE